MSGTGIFLFLKMNLMQLFSISRGSANILKTNAEKIPRIYSFIADLFRSIDRGAVQYAEADRLDPYLFEKG